MTHTPDAKTQTLPENILDRITERFGWNPSGDKRKEVAALIRSELLGSELFKAAEPFADAYFMRNVTKQDWARLRAALNELRNEGKNG